MNKEEIFKKCQQFLDFSEERQNKFIAGLTANQKDVFYTYLKEYIELINISEKFEEEKPKENNKPEEESIIDQKVKNFKIDVNKVFSIFFLLSFIIIIYFLIQLISDNGFDRIERHYKGIDERTFSYPNDSGALLTVYNKEPQHYNDDGYGVLGDNIKPGYQLTENGFRLYAPEIDPNRYDFVIDVSNFKIFTVYFKGYSTNIELDIFKDGAIKTFKFHPKKTYKYDTHLFDSCNVFFVYAEKISIRCNNSREFQPFIYFVYKD